MNRMTSDEQDEQGNLEKFEPGNFYYGEPGEDVSVISSNGRPNVDGIQWVSYLLRKVGSAVGIPLEFLLMEIGGSSFSASQAVILQYQQTVESYQTDIIRVMNRLYRRWLTQKIANNEVRIPDGVNPFAVRWQRPAFRWVNKAAQVKADMEYFRAGAMSLDDITAPFGYTAEDVLKRKAQNIHVAKRIAEAEGIEWRELINPYQTNISRTTSQVVEPTADPDQIEIEGEDDD
jgi:capsid protein